MKELVLEAIKRAIERGDDELVDTYGEYEDIEKFSDEKLLEVYRFLSEFRG